jgi:hypothetical protein
MKVKIAIATLMQVCALCCARYDVRAQTGIVNDPLHLLSNVLQFTNSLDAAMQSVEELKSIYNKGKETTEHLKEIKKQVEKINKLLRNAQEVEYAVRDLIEMADMLTQMAKQIKRASSVLSWEESTMALDMFTGTLTRATRNLTTIYDYFDEGKWSMTDKERKAAIEEEQKKIEEERIKMQNGMLAFKDATDRRRQQKKIMDDFSSGLLNRAVVSPANLAVIAIAKEEGESSSLEDLIVAASAILGDDGKKATEAATISVGKVKGVAGYFFDIYYVICGIMGLIGAYKVYSKVQQGEDFGRSAGVWFMSALLAAFLGILVQEFFFK